MARPYSISRRLIWTLSAAQVVALILGTLGILVSILLLLPRNPSPADRIVPVIAAALTAGPDNGLKLASTPEFNKLRAQNPGFWVAARLKDGRSLRYGAIPPGLEPLVATLGRAPPGAFQPSGALQGTVFIAPTAPTKALGPVDVTYGGFSLRNNWLFGLFAYFRIIFVPLLIATVLTPTLVVPLVVRRVMGDLGNATKAAEGIRFGAAGERLPTSNVPAEVMSLVKAVNDALQRLDTGQAQRQQFLADAAHELRTPIAILLTRLESLPPSEDNERLLTDVARLAEMAEQLLDVQRLEQPGQLAEGLDLVDLARGVAGELAPMAIASGYQLSFSTEVEREVIRGDAASLGRALANLVRNAIEHAGGAGEIRVAVRTGRIVEVSDDGPGVPTDRREEIFQPFHRLYPRSKGAGLGLTLVRQIVQRHGGEVRVVDGAGGARFRISF